MAPAAPVLGGRMPAMSMHFDLVDLRLTVRVAEANSLTRGAEASHISLPRCSSAARMAL